MSIHLFHFGNNYFSVSPHIEDYECCFANMNVSTTNETAQWLAIEKSSFEKVLNLNFL